MQARLFYYPTTFATYALLMLAARFYAAATVVG
jgi:hypothetical protein